MTIEQDLETTRIHSRLFIAARARLWRLGVLLILIAAAFVAFGPTGAGRPTFASHDSGLYVFGARGGIALTSTHSSGSNPLIEWADLEPREGVYAWSVLDKAISDARNSGRTLIPRVYTNVDGFAQATPDWYFSAPGAQYYYPSSGARSKDFKAPVPWDPVFEEKFGRFLVALGQRYDGNPAIEFFQTNAGGGLYGEIILSVANLMPPGYSNDAMRASHRYWIDRWSEAFSATPLSIMVNYIGGNVGEDAADYAVGRGFFLQQNSPTLSTGSQNLFKTHQDRTRIIVEAENGGCASATGSSFDSMIDNLFAYGFPIDYLTLCDRTFNDPSTASTLPAVLDRLRTRAAAPAPEPTFTPTPPATSTPRPSSTATPTPTRTPAAPASAPSPESPAVVFSESFDAGAAGWSAGGMWHLAAGTVCISPSAASPPRAFYYGQESTCNYASRNRSNKGTLTSPSISGLSSSATLTFSYWRQVESNSRRAYDKTLVQVSYNGGRTWTTVWSKSSQAASENAWTQATASLKPSGTAMKVRFVFDTVNGSKNAYTGWLIDDVTVTNK